MAGGIEGLFGEGSAARQLLVWQVLAQLLGAALTPPLELVQREANKALQATPLSPAELADMVVRNIVQLAAATEYAKESGIAPADFHRMVQGAGEPLSPQQLIEAFRRGLIPKEGTGPDAVSVRQGVAEGRTFTKYFDTLIGLSRQHLSPADAVDAVVESQISHADGEAIAALNGVTPEDFQTLINTRGNPPSPMELITLLRKGIIPLHGTGPDVISVQQGIYEGATKNKWFDAVVRLGEYIPPPRTIVAMVREGSITDDQALTFFAHNGLTEEMAAAYLTSAHHQRTAAQRDLTITQITTLYKDRIIDASSAHDMMALLRYSDAEITFLLDLADFEVEQTRVRAAVARVHSLYVAHKIDAAEATTTLDGLHIPAAGRDQMLSTWNLERDANVPELTRAEIVDAVFYEVIDLATGIAKLMDLGWSQEEALILIGIRFHGKPPPAPGP